MSEQNEAPEEEVAPDAEPTHNAEGPSVDRPRMPKVESRFLFVDIASRRAKQLRRGAIPRLDDLPPAGESDSSSPLEQNIEKIAMSEVDQGLIVYELVDPKSSGEKAS